MPGHQCQSSSDKFGVELAQNVLERIDAEVIDLTSFPAVLSSTASELLARVRAQSYSIFRLRLALRHTSRKTSQLNKLYQTGALDSPTGHFHNNISSIPFVIELLLVLKLLENDHVWFDLTSVTAQTRAIASLKDFHSIARTTSYGK